MGMQLIYMRYVYLLGIAVLLGQASPLLADTLRIGYVDLNRALQQMPQAKKAADTLNRELTVRQREIDLRREKLRQQQSDYDKNAANLSEAQRRERARQIQAGVMAIQDMQRRAQEALNIKRNQVLKDLQDRLTQVVGIIGKRGGYTLILHDKSVLYANPGIDITEQVLGALRVEALKGQKR